MPCVAVRTRGGRARPGQDVGPSAPSPARQHAPAGIRRSLARLAPRSDGPQDALWKTARACRARPRAAARLVSLLRTGGRSERSPPDCGTRRLFRPRAAAAPGRRLATRRGRGARTPPDAGLNTVIRSSVLSSQCCTRVGRFDPTTVVPAAIGRVGKTVIARAEQVHLAEDPVAHARY